MINKDAKITLLSGIVISLILSAVCLVFSTVCGVVCMISGLLITLIYFLNIKKRNDKMGELNNYLSMICSGKFDLDIRDNTEGELSILKNNLYKVMTLLKNGHLVAHNCQVVGAGKTSRAAADHGNALAGGLGDPRLVVVEVAVLNGKPLEGKNVHGVVHHAATAVHLAGMLAHQAADKRQRVVLADDLDGIGITAGLDERNVPGNVDVRRAARDARDAGLAIEAAGVLTNVMLKVITEATNGRERHGAGLVADSAVTRKVDGAGGALDQIERGLVGAALEHIGEQVAQRAQAHAAGRTLTAALRRAQVDERRRKLYGARGERTHRQATSKRIVQVVHDGLSVAAFHYMQSSHKIPSHMAARRRGRAKLLHAQH